MIERPKNPKVYPPCWVLWGVHAGKFGIVVTGTDSTPIFHCQGYMESSPEVLDQYCREQASLLVAIYGIPRGQAGYSFPIERILEEE